MHQSWRDLLFLHWTVPPEELRPLVPAQLELDLFEGAAYVGLVAFTMTGVRPVGLPPVPGLSAFHETNVRTYVHRDGHDPGVWFFSLEASNSLAVRIARWRWHLPYFRAQMGLERQKDAVAYCSRRLWPGTAGPGCEIRAKIGLRLGHGIPDRALPPGRAMPGTLEHFLIERYILYAAPDRSKLLAGRVHHSPYPVHETRLESLEETLLAATGFSPSEGPCHTAFSDGVNVEIFPLRPVG